MSKHQEQYAGAAYAQLLDQHGETVNFKPIGEDAVEIAAIFDGVAPGDMANAPSGYSRAVDVQIAKDETYGRESLSWGADSIQIPTSAGGDGETYYPIVEDIGSDAQWWFARVYFTN